MRIARLGILFDRLAAERRWRYGMNTYQIYLGEILSHAGVVFEWIFDVRDLRTAPHDIIIAAVVDDQKETMNMLWEYVQNGGHLVSYAGLNSFADKLGFLRKPTIDFGYAEPESAQGEKRVPLSLLLLHASPWQWNIKSVTGGIESGILRDRSPQAPPIGTLLHKLSVGSGRIDRWSVDIPLTIVKLQQGIAPVLEDGVPAADGTGNLNEGILKADDAVAQDWELDRKSTETGNPYFALPYADLWRECIVSHLIGAVLERNLTLPFLGYWPEGTRHVAMISHDSDINQDEHALAALEILAETGVRSTWCMIEPGYSPVIYEKVKAAGHELAFHYNALEAQGGRWDEYEFARQLEWLKRAVGITTVVSNKNHYTRFEGWGELFAWCEKYGVQSDQTRGPSKRGNVGFLFGTCQPYFPMAWFDERNRLYDVLEIGFLTQDMDLGSWADSSIIVPFLEQVQRVEGVAHFLFHQVHIERHESVRNAFRELVREARDRQFSFWTGKQVNSWHRTRRKAKITGLNEGGDAEVVNPHPGMIVWIPVTEDYEAGLGETVERRYGHRCRKQVVETAGPYPISQEKAKG